MSSCSGLRLPHRCFNLPFLLSLARQSGPCRIRIHGKAGAGAGGAGATGPRGNLRLGGLAGWWRPQQHQPAPAPAPATTTQQPDNVSSAKGIVAWSFDSHHHPRQSHRYIDALDLFCFFGFLHYYTYVLMSETLTDACAAPVVAPLSFSAMLHLRLSLSSYYSPEQKVLCFS